MHLVSSLDLTLAATLIEAGFSYPGFIYGAIGHPVSWIGGSLSFLEKRFNRPGDTPARRRLNGVSVILILVIATGAVASVLQLSLPNNAFGLLLGGVLGSSLIAQRSLHRHVRDVAVALELRGLPAARLEVSKIVGRDPDVLDAAGVARAAIESLAENFSDGIVAPVFWMALAGLPGAAVYKASNTADSMIGHRTPRYEAFGWAAARLDDALNLPASRLAALLIILAAPLAGGSAKAAWRACLRDARLHRSPNAGWPEAAMAGALGQKLGGPRAYGEVQVEGAFMGDGEYTLGAPDIRRALRLYRGACVIQCMILLSLALILRI